MKLLTATAASLALLTSAAVDAHAQTTLTDASRGISVTRAGTQPSVKGPAENFTGAVRVDSRFQGSAPARVGGGIVTFEPGARTAWHTHPLGQTLIIMAGAGLVQHWDGPVQEIKPGDLVWIPPGVKHWHGATPAAGMSHIAIAEALDAKAVDWLEKVSDEQYGK